MIFTKLRFQQKMRKMIEQSSQNPPKTIPKSIQIRKKLKKINAKTQDGLRSAKNSKKCEKCAQHDPKMGGGDWERRPPRTPLGYSINYI